MKKYFLLLLAQLTFAGYLYAQVNIDTATKVIAGNIEKTSALLKTGVAHDVITNAYQIAIKNIFGNKKEASYTSTVYGTIRLFNPNFGSGAAYQDTRLARNIEWTVSGKIDSNSNLAGFGGTLKITLLNKRDLTVRNSALAAIMNNYITRYQNDMDSAREIVESNIRNKFKALNETNSKKETDAISSKLALIQASKRKYGKSFNPADLDPDLAQALEQIHSPLVVVVGKGLAAQADSTFKKAVNEIKNKPLFTVSGTYFHVPYAKNDTTTIQSDLVFGLSKDNGNGFWEFNASGYARFFNNGVLGSAQKYHFESGCNRVLSEDANGKSNMELKGFFSYDKGNNTPGLPTAVNANLTYRYLVDKFGGFWIPITLSYNPNSGRFLGLIDLTINIDPKN